MVPLTQCGMYVAQALAPGSYKQEILQNRFQIVYRWPSALGCWCSARATLVRIPLRLGDLVYQASGLYKREDIPVCMPGGETREYPSTFQVHQYHHSGAPSQCDTGSCCCSARKDWWDTSLFKRSGHNLGHRQSRHTSSSGIRSEWPEYNMQAHRMQVQTLINGEFTKNRTEQMG